MSETIREEVAKLLWHRFAPEHHIEWDDEPHKAEYRQAAEDSLKLLALLPQSPEGMVMHCWFMEAPDGSNSAGPFDTKEQGEAWAKMSAVHAPHYAAWKAIPLYRAVSSHSQEEEMGDT